MPNSDIKSYRTGASTSGNLDTRPCGPDSGPRLTTKPPAVPSPLYRQNTATQESTPVPRDVAGFHEPNAVPGLTTQPSNFVTPTHQNGTSEAGGMQVPASVHRKDARSRESHTVPSQTMTPRTVASSLRRNGTSDGTTNIGAQMTGSPSPNIPGPHEPDPVLRQTAQSSMVLTSAVPYNALVREPDAATPECQNYNTTQIDPACTTSEELSLKETESSCGSHSPTKQTTDLQPTVESSDQEPPDTPNDELREVELDELTTGDIIIAIMGPTGAGKSSFVAKATGINEGVGHSLTSHTSEIKATRCMIGGSDVVLVDTPGFDDTKKSDLQILQMISDWLSKSYKKGTLLSGILYFHRISDNRMAGTPLKNLRVFQKLCGTKAMSQVVLVTTMWDEVDEAVGNERLEELKDNYWKLMIAQGSTTYDYRNTLESSKQLLSQLVERKRREVRLQKEIADKHLELRETDAGRELYSRLDQIAEKRAEILARITAQKNLAGDQKTADDLRKQYDSLKAELDETLQQMQALKLTSMKRAAAYIRKTFKK